MIDQLKKNKFTLWSFSTQEFESVHQAQVELAALNLWLNKQPSAVIAHGFAGTILAPILLTEPISPLALVLIGTPLKPQCPKVTIDSLEQSLQGDSVKVNSLIYGGFSTSLHPQTSQDLLSWCNSEDSYTLKELPYPILGFGSALDAVAPPETMRTSLGDNYIRIGPLSLIQEEPLHYELIAHPAMLLLISRWLKKEL